MNPKEQILNDIRLGKNLLKYAYLDGGSAKFLAVTNSSGYHNSRSELALIKSNTEELIPALKAQVVALGVGDGTKLALLVPRDRHLTLVDISSEFLVMAEQRLGRQVAVINRCLESLDFAQFSSDVTFLLLGGTLGNLENWLEFLLRLKAHCPGCNALVGMEFGSSDLLGIERMIENYRTPEGLDFIFVPLRALGLSQDHGDVKVSFDLETSRIEGYFVLNDHGTDFWYEHFDFPAPSRILLFLSHKPLRDCFFRRIQGVGIFPGVVKYSSVRSSLLELRW